MSGGLLGFDPELPFTGHEEQVSGSIAPIQLDP